MPPFVKKKIENDDLRHGYVEGILCLLCGKVNLAAGKLGRPMTLTEKILYAHLYEEGIQTIYRRGEDYVNFRPDRVAMQDATAQMALLQFMNAGKSCSAVPATVHCDHLIQACKGVGSDCLRLARPIRKYMTFCVAWLRSMALAFGSREQVLFIR